MGSEAHELDIKIFPRATHLESKVQRELNIWIFLAHMYYKEEQNYVHQTNEFMNFV